MMEERQKEKKLRVINLGIQMFCDALTEQGVRCTQIKWHPPVKQDAEIEELLDEFL